MGLFSWLSSLFDAEGSISSSTTNTAEFGICRDINPASGLPMMGCVFDVAGNVYGTDQTQDAGGINPASGLPLMGDSMIDIAGNPFGTDMTHHYDPFEHLHHVSWSSSDGHSFGDW